MASRPKYWPYEQTFFTIHFGTIKINIAVSIIFNAFREALDFELPPSPADPPARWRQIIDTYLESPGDICNMTQASAVDGPTYCVQPRSAILLARDLQQ